MDYIRLAPETLMDIERAIKEAQKQTLHQQMDEQEKIVQILNHTEATALLRQLTKKLEDNNTALRVLSAQVHKLQDALNTQAKMLEQFLGETKE